MRKSWLLCVLLGALAWGQAQPQNPAEKAPAQASPAAAPGPAQAPASAKPAMPMPEEVPENAAVLTIKGVCPAAAKTTVGTKTAGGTAAKATAAAAKKPADCETIITRAQFEKIANGLSPNVTPQLRRQLEQVLPRFMAMSDAAIAQGLENTEQFKESIKIARMQILTNELQRSVQEQADKIPPEEIEQYYKENSEAYQQFSLDRLFIPRYKQPAAEEKEESKEPEKPLTDEQQKAKEAEDKAKQEKGEQELNKLADTLRERAAAGEDFTKLQKEAFEAAGNKVENPTVNLPKVRRTGLAPAHAAVFDLKAGEVSQVISDNGGHYVYKVVSVEALPLDQVKDEIHNKLKQQRVKEAMDKYTNSFSVVANEQYFGPAAPAPNPRMRGMRPGGPPTPAPPQGAQAGPQAGAPPAANATSQPPAPAAPATKPQ
jgi:PPIC-type PPIASE domain